MKLLIALLILSASPAMAQNYGYGFDSHGTPYAGYPGGGTGYGYSPYPGGPTGLGCDNAHYAPSPSTFTPAPIPGFDSSYPTYTPAPTCTYEGE